MPSCNLFVTFQSSWCTHCLSVADLKAKALHATTAGAEKLQDVRRRDSEPQCPNVQDELSGPYSGEAPAPPPARGLVNRNTKPAPFLPPPSPTSSAASGHFPAAVQPLYRLLYHLVALLLVHLHHCLEAQQLRLRHPQSVHLLNQIRLQSQMATSHRPISSSGHSPASLT